MFNALGNIFLNRPRQAEGTDTRLGIRRHDPDQEQSRKKGREDSADASAAVEDDATVSVEALRVFLENFLDSQQEEGAHESPVIRESVPAQPQPEPAPVTGEAAQAVNAYQTTARSTRKAALNTPPEPGEPPALKLQAHEIRTIHKLLIDLKELDDSGTEFLRIERSDSFLSSLVNAVQKTQG